MCILADPTIGKGLEKCIGLCLGNSSHQMVVRVGHWGFLNTLTKIFMLFPSAPLRIRRTYRPVSVAPILPTARQLRARRVADRHSDPK
jgi:hypothetical protein